MFAKFSYFIKDFWYVTFFYFLFFSYFLLLLKFALQQKWRQSIKVIIVNLLIFLTVFLQIVYGLEAYFRYIHDESDGFGVMLTSYRWQERHINHLGQIVSAGAERFRDTKDFRQIKEKDKKRIAVVGDSIAYGFGIENIADRFSDQLEVKLRTEGYSVDVFNISKSGVGFKKEKEFIQLIAEENNFDLVILQSSLNDISAPASAEVIGFKQKRIAREKNPLFKDLINRSFVFNYYYYRFSRLTNKQWKKHIDYQINAFNDNEILNKTDEQVKAITSILKTKKIPAVAIIFPYINLLGDNYPAIQAHQQLRKIFEKNGLLVADLFNRYQKYKPEELMVNKYDAHPNELAHQLATEEIYKLLKTTNYLKYLD